MRQIAKNLLISLIGRFRRFFPALPLNAENRVLFWISLRDPDWPIGQI